MEIPGRWYSRERFARNFPDNIPAVTPWIYWRWHTLPVSEKRAREHREKSFLLGYSKINKAFVVIMVLTNICNYIAGH